MSPPVSDLPSVPVALVTGASRGIGAATAVELARRGFSVGLNYLQDTVAAERVQAEITALGGRALPLPGDVRDPAQVARMFALLDDTLGPLSVLVTAAGITRDTLLGASTPDDFSAVLSTNLDGVVNVCREATRRMIPQRRGSIVAVSSVAASHPGRGQSNYAASKGAIESFVRALAVELAPRSIRVNAVAPGLVRTDMTAALRALAPDELLRRILLRRIAEPIEIARVIAFLASPDASYVTGQVYAVDGGFKLE